MKAKYSYRYYVRPFGQGNSVFQGFREVWLYVCPLQSGLRERRTIKMTKDKILDAILPTLSNNFVFDYDDEDDGVAYLTDKKSGKEFSITIREA